MSEHDTIRELLALGSAGALTREQEERLAAHLRSCSACSREIEEWRSIAAEIRRLPTPRPPARLVQTTLARAEAKLIDQAEHEWNRRVIAFVVAFAWLITVVSWPLFRLVSGGFLSLFDPQLNRTWINFAGLTALIWLGGGSAAVLLALRQRRERRLA